MIKQRHLLKGIIFIISSIIFTINVTFVFASEANTSTEKQTYINSEYGVALEKENSKNKDYSIEYRIISYSTLGLIGEIQIKNISNYTMKNWSLEFDFNKKITLWGTSKLSNQHGNHYVIKSSNNGDIKKGETLILRFFETKKNVNNKFILINYHLSTYLLNHIKKPTVRPTHRVHQLLTNQIHNILQLIIRPSNFKLAYEIQQNNTPKDTAQQEESSDEEIVETPLEKEKTEYICYFYDQDYNSETAEFQRRLLLLLTE